MTQHRWSNRSRVTRLARLAAHEHRIAWAILATAFGLGVLLGWLLA